MGPGRPAEVVEAQPQRDGPPGPPRRPHPARHPIDQPGQYGVEGGRRLGRSTERPLRTDRPPPTADLDRPGIAVVRQRVQMPPGRPPEHRDQRGLGQHRDIADLGEPAAAQLLRGHLAHAPQPLDIQRMQELQLPVRLHLEQPVRLRDPTGHLRQELRPRHPDRDRQPDLRQHVGAQPPGDLQRRPGDLPQPADVEERLVDRQPLDQRRGVLEDLEHRLAGLGVRRHPRVDHDRAGAAAQRLSTVHRGADAVRLGLVAAGEDDAGADDHRAAAQAWVVPLLDRRVERVQVGMQDGRPAGFRTRTHVRIRRRQQR